MRYEDLSAWTGYPVKGYELVAIGWLEASSGPCAYEVASSPNARLEEGLRAFTAIPQPQLPVSFGWHTCDLPDCVPTDAGREGSGEVFIPRIGSANILYCTPRLIIHYIRVHRYEPPGEFVDSVVNGRPVDMPTLVVDLNRLRRKAPP
jgi:hypothetical protein